MKDKSGPQPIKEGTQAIWSPPAKLIPYYLGGKMCPQYYNDLHYREPPVNVDDPFRIQSHRKDEMVPNELVQLLP